MQNQAEKSRNKDLLSGTIIYGIGSFGTKVLGFLITPLYTYFIAPDQMGIYDLLMTTINLLVPIVGLQICDAVYAYLIKPKNSSRSYIYSCYHMLALNLLIALPVIGVVSWSLQVDYWQYLLILLAENLIYNTLQKILRGLKRQKLFVMSSLLYTVVFLSMNVIQICYLKRGIVGMFFSAALAYGVSILYMLAAEPMARGFGIRNGSKTLMLEMLQFAIPLIPNQLNWWIMNSSDRYIIKFFLGNTYNGIYAIAYKFPSLLQVVFSWFNNSWQDVNLSEEQEDMGEYYSRIFKSYAVFAFSLLLVLIPGSKVFIELFMGSAYIEAADYVPFLYMGTVFQTFAAFYGVGYLKNRNTKGAAVTSIYGAVVNAVVNIALIRVMGLQAASFSTFAGYFCMWLMRVWETKDTMKIRIARKKFAAYFALALLWCVVGIYGTITVNVVSGIIGGILFLLANGRMLRGLIRRM